MRVTDSITYRNFLTGLDALNLEMETASQQIATGKRLLSLKDSPSGSAEVASLRAQISELDQFRSNNDSTSYCLTIADSALNSLYNIITSIYSKGSAVASDAITADARTTTATDIRSLRDQILALANTEAAGRHIFSGSQTLSDAFTIAGDTVTYQGDQVVNSIEVGDGAQVRQNVPGSTVFQPVFGVINALLSGLDNNDEAAIRVALSSFSAALGGISQVRAQVGSDLSRLQDLKAQLDSSRTNLTAQRSRIEDANQAEAVTRLTRTETATQATLSAQTLAHQYNLFDFLA